MSILFANNATTEVAGSISAVQTQVNVAAGSGAMFPQPSPGDYFCATFYKSDASGLHEIVHVTARNGDTMTILRAQEGTQAQNWDPGDSFSNLITAGVLSTFAQGAGVASSLVYTGIDTGGPNVIVVPTTVPPCPSLEMGMTFDILVAADNTGPTLMTIGGFPTAEVRRLDGTTLVQGDLTGGQMMKLWFNGGNFNAPLQDIPVEPKGTTFYVSTIGNDANDGLSPATAFRSFPGAVYAVESRYISQQGITLQFADGTYPDSGVSIGGTYIAAWYIRGNQGNPSAVVLDGRNTGFNYGRCCTGTGGANIDFSGVTLLSYQQNLASVGARVSATNCVLSGPSGGAGIVSASGGTMFLYGNIIIDATQPFATVAEAGSGGTVLFGYADLVQNVPLHITIDRPCTCNYFVAADGNGLIEVPRPSIVTFGNPGLVTGSKHYCSTGGGVMGLSGNIDFFPGNLPGVVDAATFGWFR